MLVIITRCNLAMQENRMVRCQPSDEAGFWRQRCATQSRLSPDQTNAAWSVLRMQLGLFCAGYHRLSLARVCMRLPLVSV